ncbi:hypothetical protein CMV_024897 [Castanea mollissima]|uniref:Uncharacterized protein n=1 Tax=Castanea mollissima TaxID=60419 RepID=A0A8J4QQS0_9ROSI|nr:hypothetical protein CMV_024897 [Castanea mollissima]
MLKQSPSRNQRSKGFKVKHAIQICLLLAICIWLLYQVRHSHETKKAYEKSSGTISEKMQGGYEIIKLGRKDLHPQVEETAFETERKEELEQEIEDSKPEESEDEGRGGGDDEIDGHDQERVEEEDSDEVEDLITEEDRETEEGNEELESEGKGNQVEDVSFFEDQAQIEGERNTQEAREENYKGDDASSAVVQNTQSISTGFKIGHLRSVKEQVENAEKIEVEQDNETNSTLEVVVNIKNSGPKESNSMKVTSGASGNAARGEESGYGFDLANSDVGSNSREAYTKTQMHSDSTLMLMKTRESLNGTDTLPNPIHDVDITYNGRESYLKAISKEKYNSPKAENEHSDFNFSLPMTDNLGASNREMAVFGESEFAAERKGTLKLDESAVSQESPAKITNENENTIDRKSEKGSASLTTNENVDSVQNEFFDSSESSLYQGGEDQTTLETLAGIRNEMNNSEDATE